MIVFILLISFIARVVYLTMPNMIWWDSTIYIGMGKMIYSGGTMGLWEPFRPILFPLILGFFWKIGLDPIVVGNSIQLAASLGTIYLVYTVGEKMMPRAGIYASALLSFSGVYFFYTITPLTDIISTCLSFAAGILALRSRPFLSGALIGLAFGMRFPQALFGIVLFAVVAICNTHFEWKKTALAGFDMLLGFALWAIPYFIYTYIAYHGDVLYPLRIGQEVVANSPAQSTWWLFYPVYLVAQNPLLLFGLLPLGFWIYSYRSTLRDAHKMWIIFSIVLVGGYFALTQNYQLRYMITILPYLTLCAGIGIAYCTKKISEKNTWILLAVILSTLYLGVFYYSSQYIARNAMTPGEQEYYGYLSEEKNPYIITTSPQIAVYTNANIAEIFDTWKAAVDVLERRADNVDAITVNTCELRCATSTDAQCTQEKSRTYMLLSLHQTLFSTSTESCSYLILKGKK